MRRRRGSRAEMAPTRGRLKGIYPERKKGSKSTLKQKSKKGKSRQQCQGDAGMYDAAAARRRLLVVVLYT